MIADTIHDFDTQDGVDFLVMEYVPGTSLSQNLSAGSLPEKQLLALGTQLAQALEEAHERGVVHRDLKPGNVMITPGGWARCWTSVSPSSCGPLLKQPQSIR